MRKSLSVAQKTVVALFVLLCSAVITSAQDNAADAKTFTFGGRATLTSKGLSTFPNLTLGDPAAIFDFSLGGEKFRFEPTLRFGLDAKPWTFIFWFRYQLVNSEKFQLRAGAHPAYTFKTITVDENGGTSELLRAHQYVAGEISPLFLLSDNISIGPYYLYANGVSDGATQNSHFLSMRANFSNIGLGDNYFAGIAAQAYYLKMDENDGYYINATLSLNRKNFPVSLSSTLNKTIDSSIPGDDFLWNLNITYSFGGKYAKI